jgi:hypothetical protein
MSTDPPDKPGDVVPAGTADAGEDLCPDCGGSGRRDGGECVTCGGSGTVTEPVGGG